MKVLNGSIITILAVMFILLLCSCDDNKCRTFCKSECVVSYDIKKDSDFMVISEKWNNPRFDKEYKLLLINGEYMEYDQNNKRISNLGGNGFDFFPIVQEINLEEVGAIHIKLIYGQNPKVYETRKMRKCGIIYIKKLSQYPLLIVL